MFGGITLNIKNRDAIGKVAVIAIVAVVVAGAFGAFFLIKNLRGGGGTGGNEPYSDPLIQGAYGIGSKFTYDFVYYKEDGASVTPPAPQFTAEIVGQSGSYYMLAASSTSGGSPSPFAMIHKNTGELRFSKNIGSDSTTYGGKNVSLKKWEWVMIDGTIGDINTFSKYTLSSSPNDAIPYKIATEFRTNDTSYSYTSMDVSLVLSSTSIVPPTEYVPSGNVGKGCVYSVSTKYLGKMFTGEETVLCVAEGSGLLFAMNKAELKCGEEGITSVYYYTKSSMDSLLRGNYIPSPYGTPSSTATISTIDGNVLCDVYGYGLYVGQSNGVSYLYEQYNGSDLIHKVSLIRRIG